MVANKEKGEVELVLGGQTLIFKLGTQALVALQEHISKEDGGIVPPEKIFADAQRGRVLCVRGILWAGLQKYHPEFTINAVNDLIDDADKSDIERLLVNLGLTVTPDPRDLDELGVRKAKVVKRGGRPLKARTIAAGTGAVSTSTPGASV